MANFESIGRVFHATHISTSYGEGGEGGRGWREGGREGGSEDRAYVTYFNACHISGSQPRSPLMDDALRHLLNLPRFRLKHKKRHWPSPGSKQNLVLLGLHMLTHADMLWGRRHLTGFIVEEIIFSMDVNLARHLSRLLSRLSHRGKKIRSARNQAGCDGWTAVLEHSRNRSARLDGTCDF